jgi:hypothetical protein
MGLAWYNRERPHQALGYLSPQVYWAKGSRRHPNHPTSACERRRSYVQRRPRCAQTRGGAAPAVGQTRRLSGLTFGGHYTHRESSIRWLWQKVPPPHDCEGVDTRF